MCLSLSFSFSAVRRTARVIVHFIFEIVDEHRAGADGAAMATIRLCLCVSILLLDLGNSKIVRQHGSHCAPLSSPLVEQRAEHGTVHS